MIATKEDRESWFQSLIREGKLSAHHSLTGVIRLDEQNFGDLRNSAVDILHDSVTGTKSHNRQMDLEEYWEGYESGRFAVIITSGSIVKIGYYNFASYCRLHRAIWRILKEVNILEKITALSLANFRLVSQKFHSDQNESRPYATTKTHIDVWSGEPSDVVHLWIPIFGDSERTTLDLFRPPDEIFQGVWQRSMDDYNQAEGLVKEPPLDIPYRFGEAILFDGCCPHRTHLMNGKPRVSLDIKLCRNPFDVNARYPSTYISVSDFRRMFEEDIGRERS